MPGVSVGDLVEALRGCIADVEAARARVVAALEQTAGLIRQCQALELPVPAARASAVAERARSLDASLTQARSDLGAILAAAEALRGGTGTSVDAKEAPDLPLAAGRAPTASRTAGAGRKSPAGVPTPCVNGWRRPESVPPSIRRTGAGYAPRPAGTNRPTVGRFTSTENGTENSSGNGRNRSLESGGRDRSLASDLRHDPLRGAPVTFYQHVEAKAAAIMRREGIGDAELVLDNTVCGSTDRDRDQPWACHAILPSILPAGARLRVWVTRDGGRTWWQSVYQGTGERIRS